MKKIFSSILLTILLFTSTLAVNAETVIFNTKTKKYHAVTCQWAKKCTVNCIKIEKKEAIRQGGKPCKVCGG